MGLHHAFRRAVKIIIVVFYALSLPFIVSASIPKAKDALKIRVLEDGTQQPYVDFSVIDEVTDMIAAHAREYPPNFKNKKERRQVENELRATLSILETLLENDPGNPDLLLRAGYLHSMGHNLDFSESADKAVRVFEEYLEIEPDSPRGNYLFGMFLSSTAKYNKQGTVYLEKALELGVEDAKYTLGLNYLKAGKTEQGVQFLEEYAEDHPDSRAAMILKYHKEGRLGFGESK